jgi:hypothetical protein
MQFLYPDIEYFFEWHNNCIFHNRNIHQMEKNNIVNVSNNTVFQSPFVDDETTPSIDN